MNTKNGLQVFSICALWLVLHLILAACGAGPANPTPAIPPTQAPTATATATSLPPTRTPVPIAIPDAAFPFSQPGPYRYTSLYGTIYHDQNRGGREVAVTITYPVKDAAPDFSAAPYPLIQSTTKNANLFGDNLVSYGFVVVGVNNLDTYMPWDNNLANQPLDILFALDQVASKQEGLAWGVYKRP